MPDVKERKGRRPKSFVPSTLFLASTLSIHGAGDELIPMRMPIKLHNLVNETRGAQSVLSELAIRPYTIFEVTTLSVPPHSSAKTDFVPIIPRFAHPLRRPDRLLGAISLLL